ncbi:MAG: hypothetical protein JKY65_23750 [Planctomycetes bacterium]|nr:hypothetical protein [Planctomycetota bacterium]
MRAHVLNAFFSILFAILILSAAASHLTTEVSYTVPITITAPDQVELSYAGQSGNRLVLKGVVTVVLRGPSELLERHRQQGTIKGDYLIPEADVSEGKSLQVQSILQRRIPAGLTLQSVTPSALELSYSRRETRKVYVSPGKIIGRPAPGYRISKVFCTKNLVTVEGDVVLLNKYLGGSQDNPHYKTKPLDLTSRGSAPRSTVTVNLEVVSPDPGLRIAETVEVRVEIVPELVEEEIEFPIKFVRNPGTKGVTPLPYRVTTSKGPWTCRIKLRGPKAVLKAIREQVRNNMATDQVPFVFVEDTGLTTREGGSDNLQIRLRGLPDGVEVVDRSQLWLGVDTVRSN